MESQLKLQNVPPFSRAELRDNDITFDLSGGQEAELITNRPLNKQESFAVTFSEGELTELEFGLYEPKYPQDPL